MDHKVVTLEKIGEGIEKLNQRFDGVDQRLDGMDQRFDNIDKRFDAIDERFEGVDKRFEGIDKHFETLESKMDEGFRHQGVLLEAMQDDIDILVDGQEMLHERIDRLQGTVSEIGAKVESIDMRLLNVEVA